MSLTEPDEFGRLVRGRHEPYRVTAPHGDDGRVHASFQDACDVNKIVAKFQRTNVLTHTSRQRPRFADVYDAEGLLSSFGAVEAAREQFEGLPSGVRRAAGNDPVRFLEMLEDEDGAKVLGDAGLIDQVEPVAPIEVVIAPSGEAPVAPVTETS